MCIRDRLPVTGFVYRLRGPIGPFLSLNKSSFSFGVICAVRDVIDNADLDRLFFVFVVLEINPGFRTLHFVQYHTSGICVLFSLAHLMWIQVEQPVKWLFIIRFSSEKLHSYQKINLKITWAFYHGSSSKWFSTEASYHIPAVSYTHLPLPTNREV